MKNSKQGTSYTTLPKYYDRFVQARGQNYDDFVNWIITLSNIYNLNLKRILSLGSGNCTAEILLAKKDFFVSCVDNSTSMIQESVKKFLKNHILNYEIIKSSITDYKLNTKVEMAFSHYFCINYLLTIKELEDCFTLTYLNLKNHGIFLFDVIQDLPNPIKEKVLFYNNETFKSVLEMTYLKDNIGCTNFYNFFKLKNGLYDLVEEIHYQRGYTIEEITNLLIKAGFKRSKITISKYLNYTPINDSDRRIVFIAQK